jgi:ABC-type Fe3+ transport system substrate-binding protein
VPGLGVDPPVCGSSDWKKEWEQTLPPREKKDKLQSHLPLRGLLQDFSASFWHQRRCRDRKRHRADQPHYGGAARGKFIADVYSGGTNSLYDTLYKGKALDPIKPALILPEVTDTSKWFGSEHRYADPEGKYIFAFIGSPSNAQLSYNTKLVDPKEFRSYWDVTNSKWKGKIVSLDPRDAGLGATMQFYYYSPEIGPEFLKKFFGGMDITYAKNFRQMTDWLAQGKFAICMGCKDSMRAKHQGLPVDDFDTNRWKEGSSFSAGGGSFSLMNQAPHPNAAKVFINWFLAQRPDRAAKTRRSGRSRQLAAHRHSQGRHSAGQSLAARREIFRRGEAGIRRHEAHFRSGKANRGGGGERQVGLTVQSSRFNVQRARGLKVERGNLKD